MCFYDTFVYSNYSPVLWIARILTIGSSPGLEEVTGAVSESYITGITQDCAILHFNIQVEKI